MGQAAHATAIDQQRFVAAAEQVAKDFMPGVISLGVGPQEPFDPGDQVRVGCLDDQMEMVGHQTEAMHLPSRFLTAVGQRAQKPLPVRVVAKEVLSVIPAVHHVIDGAAILDAQLPSQKNGMALT